MALLRRETGPTFSDLWYRVESTRPRLSPHAHVTRQIYAESVVFIVEDPAGTNYYRISEPAAFFLGLLDGQRTVGEAWDSCVAQRGDEAPTQRECIDLLGKLQLYGLLLGELPLAADMVMERKRQTRKRLWVRRTGRGLFPNVPLFNPEPFLERHKQFVKLCFSRWGLAAFLVLGLIALWHVVSDWQRLSSPSRFTALIDPSNLLLLSVAFMVMRSLHEMGHAAACKAMGGRVTEIGVMLIAFVLPVPYCDASSSWKFPRTRDRVLVGAGGVLVEMFFASIAAIIWARTPDGSWVEALTFNVMVLSSTTTLLFNLNPLLRYDGYYIMSDLLGIANLAQKSRELWSFMTQRILFGVRSARPPEVRSRLEAWILGIYGLLGTPYRIFVMLSILLLISSRYLGLGMVLAAVLVSVWVIWPFLKAVGFLVSSPNLMGHRPRAFGVTLGLIALAGVVLGVVPVPAGTVASGTVEPARVLPVRVGEGGFLTEVRAAPNSKVVASAPMFVFSSPELMADLEMSAARVKQARASHEKADLRGTRAEERVAFRDLERRETEFVRVTERAANLVLAAPADGTFVIGNASVLDATNLIGRYFQRGTLLGNVSAMDDVVVRVAVSDREAAHLFKKSALESALKTGEFDDIDLPVRIRVPGRFGETITGRVIRGVGAGSRELHEASLGTASGGDIAPDPEDQSGRRTLWTQFVLEVRPDKVPEEWKPGLRARVRFDLPPQPLLVQWWRLGRQYMKGRLG